MTYRPDNLMQPTPIITNAHGVVYHPGTRSFSIEAAMLAHAGAHPTRVYTDAADEGFTLISHRTGEEVIVALSRIDRQDGDVLSWEYASVWPRDADIRFTVLND